MAGDQRFDPYGRPIHPGSDRAPHRLLVPGPAASQTRAREIVRAVVDRFPGAPLRWLALPFILVLAFLVLYPLAAVLVASVSETGEPGSAGYFGLLGSSLGALGNTLYLAAGSVLLSAAVGIPLALALTNRDFPGRRVVAVAAVIPALIPSVVVALSLILLFGEEGLWASLAGTGSRGSVLEGALGDGRAVFVAHAYAMYPWFYVLLARGIARLDPAVADQARVLGAGKLRVLRSAILPQLRPSILTAVLAVFVLSVSSFTAPQLLGGGFDVLTTRIYQGRVTGALLTAYGTSTLLLALSLGVFGLLRRTDGQRQARIPRVHSPGARRARRAVARPEVRALASFGSLTFLALLALPLIAVLWSSLTAGSLMAGSEALSGLVSGGAPGGAPGGITGGITLRHLLAILEDPALRGPIGNSLRMAALATLGCVGLAAGLAWVVVRGRPPEAPAVRVFAMVPWAIPGVVLGVALTAGVSGDGPNGEFGFDAAAMMTLAYLIQALPCAVWLAFRAVERADPLFADVAATLGEPEVATARRIMLPLVLPGLAGAALIAFALALSEFAASIVLQTHPGRPIAVELFARLGSGDLGGAAALGLLLVGVAAACGGVIARYVAPRLGLTGRWP